MVAAGAGPRRLGPERCVAVAALVALALYAALEAVTRGDGAPVEPWPLGGDGRFTPFGVAALLVGLLLGWALPGLPLALLARGSLDGPRLLARALGLGVGYVLVTGLLHAALLGRFPGRVTLLVLLALPAFLALARPRARLPAAAWRWPLAACALALLVAALLWPKLAREGLNGDGTEAYELARSLLAHPLPRWDLEREAPPGRFGTPAVNPLVTHSALAAAQMALLGRGELAARLPLVGAVALLALLPLGLVRRVEPTAVVWLAAVVALSLLWNAHWVGYEPAFSDLAEPAGTDLLMTALVLGALVEAAGGGVATAVACALLASGVLYSAPVLATVAFAALARSSRSAGTHSPQPALRRGPLRLAAWLAAAAACLGLAILIGALQGDLGDWLRQLRAEYWGDFVTHERRTPTLPILGLALAATGGLPLALLGRWRALGPAPRAAALAAGAYLLIVAASSYKNLHYLTPVPFLLAPAALDAAGLRARLASLALVALAFGLSWPDARGVRRETIELGRVSSVSGLDYEPAALAGDVLYDVLGRPGGRHFAVGKHTFVRYALELGGAPDAVFRLASEAPPGWITLAEHPGARLSTRDPAALAAWRLRTPPAPSAPLFSRPAVPPLSAAPEAWRGHHEGDRLAALVLGRRDASGRLAPAEVVRVLVPAPGGVAARLTFAASEPRVLAVSVNGRPAGSLALTGAASTLALPPPAAPEAWRDGWNLVALRATEGAVPALRSLGVPWPNAAAERP